MYYKEKVVKFLKVNHLKNESNTEMINCLRSEYGKTWEWIYLALNESDVEGWLKYGLALMRKPDFKTRIDEKIEAKRRRLNTNGHLTAEQIKEILNPPTRTIYVQVPWSPWSAVQDEKQERFVQTSKGVYDSELKSVIWFFPDYDYSFYLEDCKLGNIRCDGQPSSEALGYKQGKSTGVGKRSKLFDI